MKSFIKIAFFSLLAITHLTFTLEASDDNKKELVNAVKFSIRTARNELRTITHEPYNGPRTIECITWLMGNQSFINSLDIDSQTRKDLTISNKLILTQINLMNDTKRPRQES